MTHEECDMMQNQLSSLEDLVNVGSLFVGVETESVLVNYLSLMDKSQINVDESVSLFRSIQTKGLLNLRTGGLLWIC